MNDRRLSTLLVVAPLCLLAVGAVASRTLNANVQATTTAPAAVPAVPAGVPATVVAPHANSTTFDFKDPKGVNAIGFFLDSELEPITGFASGLSGTIAYEPAEPRSFSGTLMIDAGKIQTSNPRMTSVLQGADWIDLGNHLTVRFSFNEVLAADRVKEGVAKLRVRGSLMIRGIAIEKTVDIEVTHLPDAAARRGGAESGDLLVLRSRFAIDRTEFNVKPEGGFEKVARDIHLNVAITGYSN